MKSGGNDKDQNSASSTTRDCNSGNCLVEDLSKTISTYSVSFNCPGVIHAFSAIIAKLPSKVYEILKILVNETYEVTTRNGNL